MSRSSGGFDFGKAFDAMVVVRGFAVAMSKEVLGGGLGEVVSMARSNLRNVPKP